MVEHTIELRTGYTDGNGKTHKTVTFGKRLTAADLIALDSDPRSGLTTNYNDMVLAPMITKFGDLQMPLTEFVLLGLTEIDREDLARAYYEFLSMTRPQGPDEWKPVEGTTDMWGFLPQGFLVEGRRLNRVLFGNLTTGRDSLAADSLGLKAGSMSYRLFIIARQIKRLETMDGSFGVDGPIGMDLYSTLDSEETEKLLGLGGVWKAKFRLFGKPNVEGDGKADPDNAQADGNDGSGGAGDAGGQAQDVFGSND